MGGRQALTELGSLSARLSSSAALRCAKPATSVPRSSLSASTGARMAVLIAALAGLRSSAVPTFCERRSQSRYTRGTPRAAAALYLRGEVSESVSGSGSYNSSRPSRQYSQ